MRDTGSRRIRVLHIAGEYPPRRIGGVSTYVDNIVSSMRHTVTSGVAVVNGSNYERDPSHLAVRKTIPIRVNFDALKETRVVLTPKTIAACLDPPQAVGPGWDLIHIHDWYGVIPAIAYTRSNRIPCVMTLHLPLHFGFTYANHPVPLPLERRIEALGLRTATRIFAPSKHVASTLAGEYSIPESSIRVIPNGVDTVLFQPAASPALKQPSSRTLVCVCRLTEQKGLDLLIDVMRVVSHELPGTRLLIAGDGPYRASLEYLIHDSGLDGNVELLGHIQHSALPTIYQQADVFVSTSAYEPFGLTTLEAMACGLPAVVSSVGGAHDYLRRGRDGWIHLPHDTLAFAEAVLAILKDSELRAMMSANARARSCEYSWSVIAPQLRREYSDVLTAAAS
jgi:glycosyltransferase involved in cell wall biosynthesis